MNLVECLKRYKMELCDLLPHNKKLILDNFTRWYINAPKRKNGISVSQDVVHIADLEFANLNHAAGINIKKFVAGATSAFSRYRMYSKRTILNYPPPDLSIISGSQLRRLKNIYRGSNFDNDVSQLIELYKLVGMNNIHLSIPPIFNGVELFGSPLNTHNEEYCSPFEFERVFGSSGSFWKYKFTKSGLYLCNPPFDDHIVEKMAIRLLKELLLSQNEITIFITIPVWDSETQRKLGIKDYGLGFRGFTLLKESEFAREHTILNKFKYPYFDYYKADSPNCWTPASWTHALILANHKNAPRMSSFTDAWASACATT